MLIETFSNKGLEKPNIDRANGRLNNVVIMTTEFNHNKNATFTKVNQEEIVNLGSSEKIWCYLGHAKRGFTSNDRLPFRIGFFENFSIEGTTVKADLILSPTLEENPVLKARVPGDLAEYIFKLAENESGECGFSMSVGMSYNDDDTVSILALYSIDLVEDPALTRAMFSNINKDYSMDETKTTPEESETVLEATAEPAPVQEDAPKAEELEGASETKDETPKDEQFSADRLAILEASVLEMKTLLHSLVTNGFSKVEEPKEEKKEKLVFSVSAPISHETSEAIMTKEQHRAEYHRLRKDGKLTEAAAYAKINLK